MNIDKTIAHIVRDIRDPVSAFSLHEMGVMTRFHLEDDEILIQFEIGFPRQFLKDQVILDVQTKLQEALPNHPCQIQVTERIRPHRTQLPGKGLREVKNVIAIASGKGGVGKSTVAVNLATALASAGARVGLLDADIYGPSIPIMLGKVPKIEVVDEGYLPVYVHGIQAMSIGYLTAGEEALIWRGPMLAKSLIQMLDITRWCDLDYLLIDLPPGTGDIQLSLVQKIPLSGAIVITTPQQVATLDAQKAIKMFEKTNIPLLGIVENMSQFVCKQCGHAEEIFGHGGAQALAKTAGCALLGQLPFDPRIAAECDKGTPSVLHHADSLSKAFMEIAHRVAIELSKRPLNYADKIPPIVAE